ncbi:predicted protein [Lichtheimia corymbifera JMRC:FSU:9682]|uniref:Uncharacterized protein n=1 Tax=Lichtheimia corymbifera JMRC:FSU:9682 TaxID=1263082 RepID=A0A068SAN2_9FUNG|nr:predicted protein [Lichtheimia corymbifera JMRC:FSU:9682]
MVTIVWLYDIFMDKNKQHCIATGSYISVIVVCLGYKLELHTLCAFFLELVFDTSTWLYCWLDTRVNLCPSPQVHFFHLSQFLTHPGALPQQARLASTMTMNTLQDESVRDHNAGLGHSGNEGHSRKRQHVFINLCMIIIIVDHPSDKYPMFQCKAFVDITTEIRSTVDHLLQLYQKRSQISISHAKFQAAFRDADTMCSIDPQSPLGYLCMGDIYREQGRQKKAIEAYTTGMNTASSNHPSYSALAKSKEAATLQQAKRIDFITQLPVEVVSQFIVPVILKYQPSSMYRQWSYLGVSRAWRNRLLHPSPLHYEVQEPYQTRVAHVNELDKFKDYVRSVTVYRFRGGDDSAEAFPWRHSRSLRRLQLFAKQCEIDYNGCG